MRDQRLVGRGHQIEDVIGDGGFGAIGGGVTVEAYSEDDSRSRNVHVDGAESGRGAFVEPDGAEGGARQLLDAQAEPARVVLRGRSEERRVGEGCRSRWAA